MLKKAWLWLLLLLVFGVQAQQADHYWQWGWGTYGNGLIEDIARFDWSLVNFGSVPDNQQTVDRCNAPSREPKPPLCHPDMAYF